MTASSVPGTAHLARVRSRVRGDSTKHQPGLSEPGSSCRTTLGACRSRRWSRSPNDWVGAQNVWLMPVLVPESPARPTLATATVHAPVPSQNRSVGRVKRSTKLPDEVTAPNWRGLSVVLNDRAAIYAEEFPAVLAAAGPALVQFFTHEEAQSLLFTFAGAWPVLGRDADDPSTRFAFVTIGDLVCRFRGIELAPGAIVVDDVMSL